MLCSNSPNSQFVSRCEPLKGVSLVLFHLFADFYWKLFGVVFSVKLIEVLIQFQIFEWSFQTLLL